MVDDLGQTSIPGIFAAGNVSGIEEVSSAMPEGRIAGLAAASYLGFATPDEEREGVGENERARLCRGHAPVRVPPADREGRSRAGAQP